MINSRSSIARSFIAALFMVLFFSLSAQAQLTGEYRGTDNSGAEMTLVFSDNGEVVMKSGGEVMGGPGFEVNGLPTVLRYEHKTAPEPDWLDLVFCAKEGLEEFARIKGLVRFESADVLLYRANLVDETRYTDFDPEDKDGTVRLTRVH